jgi:hypothetical protein
LTGSKSSDRRIVAPDNSIARLILIRTRDEPTVVVLAQHEAAVAPGIYSFKLSSERNPVW